MAEEVMIDDKCRYDFRRGDFIIGIADGNDRHPIFDIAEPSDSWVQRSVKLDHTLLVTKDHEPGSPFVMVLDLIGRKEAMVLAPHFRVFDREKP